MGLKTIAIFIGLCVPFFLGTIWAVVDVAQKDFGKIRKNLVNPVEKVPPQTVKFRATAT